MTDEDGGAKTLMIRRLVCHKCNQIHHELPDCVVPYKRHCAGTIEKIIIGDINVPCESRTIRRILAWWHIVLPYFLSILEALAEKYKIGITPAFRKIVRAVVNSNCWIFKNSFCTRSAVNTG